MELRPRGLVVVAQMITIVDWGLVVGERRDEVRLEVVVVVRVLKTATSVLLRTVKKLLLGVIDFAL